MATKRVSEMTEAEYAVQIVKQRAWAKHWRETPKAKGIIAQSRAKMKAADPEAWNTRSSAYCTKAQLKLRAEDPEKFRARMQAKWLKHQANLSPEARERQLRRYRALYRSKTAFPEKKARAAMKTIKAGLPAFLPAHVRDEVAGALILAVIDGTIILANLAGTVAEYLRAHNRQFDHHKVLSLDATIPGMKSSWVDALPNDAEHY